MAPQIVRFCLLVMAVYETWPRMAASSVVDTGWQPGKLYEYEVQGWAYASLPQLGDQATGVEVEAARVAERRRATRPEGAAPPPDDRLRFRALPLQPGAWALRLSSHGVGSLLVNESLAPSEVNFIKALASRLVVNTGGTKPEDDRSDIHFTVMEVCFRPN
ncbi:Protein of unknown function [Gryllus bimaculatus]|nr:Protein of unknown function [Gryllus bimaculatus]